MMNPDAYSEGNFHLPTDEMAGELLSPARAEDSIVQTILNGSGGPSDSEISECGLRFVRYLLSRSRPARHGFLPNFTDMKAVRLMAQDFIRRSGGPSLAMEKLLAITGSQCF